MKIFIALLLIYAGLYSYSQERPCDAYLDEESGYFICINPAGNNIIMTDNYSGSLYRISDGNLETMITSPGCGRYYSVSPDGKFIGFKMIKDGMQAPALYNIESGTVSLLMEPVPLCGQVYFSGNNDIIFSAGNTLRLISDDVTRIIDIGTYSNITPVSPDGKSVIYSTPDDELALIDLLTEKKTIITEKGKMSAYPQWSPDGNKILYQSGNMYIYDLTSGSTIDLGNGIGPRWSPGSENIVFYRTETDGFAVKNSELFMISCKGGEAVQLTATEDVCEMQPVFSDDQSVLYHTYSGKEIRSMHLQTDNKKIDKLIYCHTGQLNLSFPSLNSNKSEVRIPGTVPYVHQVYDTPDWHYGYGSCAPSTSAMALAYYNRLPKWPKTVSSPYSHISDYGYYVADKYTIDEYYYDVVEQTGGGEDAWGGYGYMWGLGSPNSYMSSYIAGHYLTSSQLWSSSCTFSVVTNEIDDGYPYPMCAMLSSAGHLVLTKGYIVGQHTLIFNDPYGDKNTPGWPSYDGHNAYYDWPGYNNGYQNLDYNGTYGIIAWLVTSRGSEVTYNDTLIDDLFYNHGFNMNNSANGSHMRYFHDVNAGYDNHFWFTYTMDNLSDICWVTWEPVLPKSGMYEVSAFIPSVSADAAGAIYHVKHAGGETIVLIDQDTYNDQWVSLGTYTFDTSMVNYVYLGDSTGIDGESIAFDAVKWSYMPVPDVDFYAGTQVVCTGETVQFNNASVDADTWLWTFEGGDPVSSSEENPAVTYNAAGNWDVTLVGSGTGGSDTLYFDDYITVHASPVADFEANDTVIYLPTAVATFNNFSSDAASYFWDFGNGQTSSDSNPYCIYTLAGDYTVSLVAGNGNCPNDTLMRSTYIHVMNGTSDNDPQTKKMSVYPNPFSETIQIDNPNGYLISGIRITDMAGRIMYRKKLESQGDLIIENILTDAERGVYVLILMVNGSETRFNMIKE